MLWTLSLALVAHSLVGRGLWSGNGYGTVAYRALPGSGEGCALDAGSLDIPTLAAAPLLTSPTSLWRGGLGGGMARLDPVGHLMLASVPSVRTLVRTLASTSWNRNRKELLPPPSPTWQLWAQTQTD